jgi:hypothetical protein
VVALATASGGVSYPQASVRTLIELLLARVHEGVRPVEAAIGGSSWKLRAAIAVPGSGRVLRRDLKSSVGCWVRSLLSGYPFELTLSERCLSRRSGGPRRYRYARGDGADTRVFSRRRSERVLCRAVILCERFVCRNA